MIAENNIPMNLNIAFLLGNINLNPVKKLPSPFRIKLNKNNPKIDNPAKIPLVPPPPPGLVESISDIDANESKTAVIKIASKDVTPKGRNVLIQDKSNMFPPLIIKGKIIKMSNPTNMIGDNICHHFAFVVKIIGSINPNTGINGVKLR